MQGATLEVSGLISTAKRPRAAAGDARAPAAGRLDDKLDSQVNGLLGRRRNSRLDGRLDGRLDRCLEGMSFAALPGCVTAVLGEAGSGRSALVRAVAGLDRTDGTVLVDGVDVSGMAAARRGFGVVLHGDALSSWTRLAGNVAGPLRRHGVARGERSRIVAETLDLLGLAPLAGQWPGRLSAAERRRACLARAAVLGPRLLLLDDPFAGQDLAEREVLAEGLRGVQALLGVTTLLTTGRGEDALAVAEQVVVVRRGRVVQHGMLQEVFNRPASLYVASLLGEVNRLAGHIVEIEDDIALVRLDCGPVVEARLAGPLAPNGACTVGLRPDRIALAAASAAEMGGHAVDATVVETRFMGESYRLRLLIGTGAEVVVLRAAAAGLRGVRVGGSVALAWQAHHASVFEVE